MDRNGKTRGGNRGELTLNVQFQPQEAAKNVL